MSMAPCPEVDFTQEEIPDLPIATVWVNIHFVGHAVFGNFYPGASDDLNATNGNKWAELMLQRANERMSDLTASPTSLANFLGDSKIRYQLYTDPSNASDLYGGVWFWDTPADVPTSLPYGTNVLNIMVTAPNTPSNPGVGGFACGTNLCNKVTMTDALYNVNTWGWWSYANILNHEFGHVAGLCHAFYCSNPCDDLDPVVECNKNGNCYTSCGASPGTTCDPWTSGSTNIMGYNGHNRSLTPCQWQTIMKNLVYHTPNYVTFCGESITPLVIASGSDITWDKIKILNRDLIIEPLAQLTVKCEVRLAAGRTITVNRGSRLIVDGGKLTNLCKGSKWQGVRVHGNNNISHSPAMIGGPLVAGNPGVVNLIDAEVLNASNAISCNPAVSWPDLTQNWNGIVVGTNSIFRNNSRSVEFMLDDKANINPDGSFTIVADNLNVSGFNNCQFLNDDGTAQVGVTDWAASNIVFEKCLFKKMPKMGLQTWDAGVIVTGSKFENNHFGIHATATADLTSQLIIGGDTDAQGNTFTSNAYGIYSTTIQDMVVSHNKFNNNQVGQYSFGKSEYDTNNNTFSGGVAGISNLQTDNGWKRANCNVYTSVQSGITNEGNNMGMRFDHEEFSTTFDVHLSNYNTPNDPGRLPNQGNVGAADWNYFTNNSNRNIVTFGDTEAFTYFYPGAPGVSSRTKPKCSLNDNVGASGLPCTSTNEFFSFKTSGGAQGCLPPAFGGEPDPKREGLITVNAELAKLQRELELGGGDKTTLMADISNLTAMKEYILNRLTKELLAKRDFQQLEEIYSAENDVQKLVGLKIRQGQWQAAAKLLDRMDINTLDDEYFKQTQLINLKRLQSTQLFQLDDRDRAALEEASNSKTKTAPYAQALLGLLTGVIFEPPMPMFGEDITYRENTETETLAPLSVVPNPTTGEVRVQLPIDDARPALQVKVMDLSGRTILTMPVGQSEALTFSMENEPNGVYFVALLDNGHIVNRVKLVVMK